MPERLFSGEGSINIRVLFWLLVFTLALYVGYVVVPPTFSYLMMKTEVKEQSDNAYMYSNEALTNRLLSKAEIWSVPIDTRDIIIRRWRDEIDLEVNYSVDLVFFGVYKRTVRYHISATGQLKDTTHILE